MDFLRVLLGAAVIGALVILLLLAALLALTLLRFDVETAMPVMVAGSCLVLTVVALVSRLFRR